MWYFLVLLILVRVVSANQSWLVALVPPELNAWVFIFDHFIERRIEHSFIALDSFLGNKIRIYFMKGVGSLAVQPSQWDMAFESCHSSVIFYSYLLGKIDSTYTSLTGLLSELQIGIRMLRCFRCLQAFFLRVLISTMWLFPYITVQVPRYSYYS